MERKLRKREEIDCDVEVGKVYKVEVDAVIKPNMHQKDINLLTQYIGKCVYKNDDIVVFDKGTYKVCETICSYKIDWEAKGIWAKRICFKFYLYL